MKNVFKFVFAIFMASLLLLNVAYAWDTTQVTTNSGTELNVDIDVDSNHVVHRVYERDGNIYYTNSDTNTESLVSAGTNPAIAVGPNNVPQIVFENSGQVKYAIFDSEDWVFATFAGRTADIDVNSNNVPYVVYMNNDQYADVMLSVQTEPGVFSNTIIYDGYWWYEYSWASGAGRYFDNPRIIVDSEGYYHIIAWHHSYDKGMGWVDHSYYTVYTSNANGGMNSAGTSRAFTKNALTVDSNNVAHLVYGANPIYYVTLGNNVWSESSLVALGSSAAIASKGTITGVTYVYDGSVYYIEDAGVGFGSSELIDSGSAPVVGLGSKYIDYIKNNEVYEASTDIPSCVSTTEVCDGLDNDCNGVVDDGLTAKLAPNQMGVCAGDKLICQGVNGWVAPVPDAEICDGKDNDCDGTTDEGVCSNGGGSDDCEDGDNDGYGEDCDLGDDCNDNNPESWRVDTYWVDYDGDGYHLTGLPNMNANSQIAICYGASIPYPYVTSIMGADCNDNNASLTTECPIDEVEVPEFGLVAGIVALVGALGVFMYRRK